MPMINNISFSYVHQNDRPWCLFDREWAMIIYKRSILIKEQKSKMKTNLRYNCKARLKRGKERFWNEFLLCFFIDGKAWMIIAEEYYWLKLNLSQV